ncbi:MAG: TrfB-related DNA-binding protein [Candidatus Paceibacterota bacterium]|jgi:transposase-like protein
MKEAEFREVVAKTRLGDKSREAARRVLVDGERQADVCRDMGVVPAQLSRSLSVLEREAEKLNEQANKVHGLSFARLDLSRAEAVKEIRDILGDEVLVRNPPENGLCAGKILVKTEFHLVQDLLKGQVMVHELAKLDMVPKLGESCQLKYEDGFARLIVAKEKSQDIENIR